MEEITIELSSDDNNNIIIKNCKTKQKIEIDHKEKKLNAKDVYELFSFEKGNKYDVKSSMDYGNDKNIENYYNCILELFNGIKNELNKIEI